VWAKVGARLEAVLTESAEWTGAKQQLTATRLHELLVAEGHHDKRQKLSDASDRRVMLTVGSNCFSRINFGSDAA
jgi:hypothetical protein